METHKVIKEYKEAVEAVIIEFCKKQDVNANEWVLGIVGENIHIGDYIFYFGDIVIDIEQNAPVGAIFEWNDKELDKHFNDIQGLNYDTYLKIQQ